MADKKKVFVGLSGGVDSAVSAALLKKDGYEVTGLFARIALEGYPCTAGVDRRDALRVATHLDIPFEEIDLSEAYRANVFENALAGYKAGETPNPDALCNREIKFGLLYDFAMQKGADYFATGHYARIEKKGEAHLMAGRDPEKDQSYFLWAVPEERLKKTMFPVGNLHKRQVRALAERFGLPNAARKDSQGLCFLGDVSMEEALIKELKPKAGKVLDEHGAVIGSHRGALLYTIGERHGFTITAHTASDAPRYVVAKDIKKNTITVSAEPLKETAARTVLLREENFPGSVESGPCSARLRYRQALVPAELMRMGSATRVRLLEPQQVALGQSLVLYRGERCLGGGIMTELG